MTAEPIMRREIISVSPGTSLAEVANILFVKDISDILVVDENKKLHGLVSEKDLYRRLYSNYE